jgi:HK97 family phage prohead protease
MEKSLNTYQIKSQELMVKDLDEGSRQVAMYLSKFDNIDSDFDIIRKGAFKKSIMERGPQSASNRKIAFLRYHNWEMPIGKFLELNEDDNGLYAVAQLSESTMGNDALIDYKEGIIREHSIGFKYVKDKIRHVEDETMASGGFYEVSEVQLFEGSAVTFGANEMTNVVEVAKAEGKESVIERIAEEIGMVTKSLTNGKGTDERLYSLEMKLKYLNSRLIELAKADPFNKQSVKGEPQTQEVLFEWNKVVNKLT